MRNTWVTWFLSGMASLAFLLIPGRGANAKPIDTGPRITKSTPLILHAASQAFPGDPAHASHASHESHASHASHESHASHYSASL